MKKVHKQGEDSDSIISEIPILTVALFWSASNMTGSSQNRDLRYNRITIFTLFMYFFHDPYSPFLNQQFI